MCPPWTSSSSRPIWRRASSGSRCPKVCSVSTTDTGACPVRLPSEYRMFRRGVPRVGRECLFSCGAASRPFCRTPFFFSRLLRKMIFFEHRPPSLRPVRVFIPLKNRHHTDETQDRASFFLTKKEQINKLLLPCSTLSNLLIDKLL